MIKGRLSETALSLGSFQSKKSKSEIGPKVGSFGEKRRLKFLILVLHPPKGTSLCGTVSFSIFFTKISAHVLAVAIGRTKEMKKLPRQKGCAWSCMHRNETPYPVYIKFCMVVGFPDVIMCANFGEDRLRGFWVAGGHSSYAFIVALTTLSHYLASVWCVVWACVARRRWLGEEMHGVWSRGSQTNRKTKVDLERGCEKGLSST